MRAHCNIMTSMQCLATNHYRLGRESVALQPVGKYNYIFSYCVLAFFMCNLPKSQFLTVFQKLKILPIPTVRDVTEIDITRKKNPPITYKFSPKVSKWCLKMAKNGSDERYRFFFVVFQDHRNGDGFCPLPDNGGLIYWSARAWTTALGIQLWTTENARYS